MLHYALLQTIEDGKVMWKKIIQKWISDTSKTYQIETKRLWKLVMDKAPTDITKELAKADL